MPVTGSVDKAGHRDEYGQCLHADNAYRVCGRAFEELIVTATRKPKFVIVGNGHMI